MKEWMEPMECDICRTKPGSSPLCKSCYHNRELFRQMKSELESAETKSYPKSKDVNNKDNWIDISNEQWRKYRFPDKNVVEIIKPIKLMISGNGHRIVDAGGLGHYIPVGWIHLCWCGDPAIVY